MLEAGRLQRHVAYVHGVSQCVVSGMWNRLQMTGNVLHGHAGGRERPTTQAQGRFNVLQCLPTVLERNDFQKATGVCKQTNCKKQVA
jgi:hypothetical protein